MPDELNSDPLVSNLDLIQSLVHSTCRRGQLKADETDDFSSYVMLKLIENNYRRLRRFRGESSLKTYLTVVIQRLLLDFRTKELGKWRPSTLARRMGDVAVRLEQLLWRDGYSFCEAVSMLDAKYGICLDREDLWRIAIALPRRSSFRVVSLDRAEELADRGGADVGITELENRELATALQHAFEKGIHLLSEEERLMIRMRFQDGLTAEKIGTVLNLNRRVVYSQIKRSLLRLRGILECEGLTGRVVGRILESNGNDVCVMDLLHADQAGHPDSSRSGAIV